MNEKLKVLDLFSGIGGFSLGLERTGGFETVAFCEIEEFPRKVLNKHWPDVPIYNDVRELTKEQLDRDEISVDVICGGYPCQPFSTAGGRRGEADDRHLWPEYLRLIREMRPRWIIAENVAGHVSMGLDSVLSDLEGEGYRWEALIIPACAVDAKHRRDRLWVMAYPESNGGGGNGGEFQGQNESQAPKRQERRLRQPINAGEGAPANAAILQRNGGDNIKRSCDQPEAIPEPGNSDWFECGAYWENEPRVGRVVDGVPSGMDRLKSLGNAVVPQIPEILGRAILQHEAQV
jgi:DNA (cytosine-5)-methyltransferase 1